MQDGFIFSDTIAKNVALSEDIDPEKLFHSIKVANLDEFIDSLPMKHHCKIGQEGIGIRPWPKNKEF